MIKQLIVGVAILSATAISSFAETLPELKKDKNLISGVLKNGLTYHIYPSNDEKKDDHDEKIAYRLFVKIGSIDENDQEKGFAHLVEHLGFRDSRYFTHKEKSDFLENLGLHTNAYTTYDRTVYYVNDRKPSPERLDQNLKLFRDFADGMFITQSDFELERKIVLEELRWRAAKEDGISDRLLAIYDQGQYLDDKKPIGTKEVLENATRDQVYAFFKKWYKPQFMHLIITGNVDGKAVEEKVKKLFSEISPDATKRQELPEYKLFDGLHFATADDATSNNVEMHFALPEVEEKGDYKASNYQNGMDYSVIAQAISSKIKRLNDQYGKVIPAISIYPGRFEHRSYLGISFTHKEGERKAAIAFVLNELANLRVNGFSQAELENQMALMERRIDKPTSPLKKDGRPRKIADQLIDDLNEKLPHISEDVEKEQLSYYMSQADLERINGKMKKLLKKDITAIVISREEVDAASKDMISDNFKAYQNDQIAVNEVEYQLEAKSLPKLDVAAGEITTKKEQLDGDHIEYTLSNGAKVYWYKRKTEDGQINVTAMANGGRFGLPKNMQASVNLMEAAIAASGMAGLGERELNEYLAKQRIVSFSPFVGKTSHGISFKMDHKKGLEPAFNAMHRSFYQGKVHEDQLKALKDKLANDYEKWYQTEQGGYYKGLNDTFLRAGIEYVNADPAEILKVDLNNVELAYQMLYGDLSKFNFVIMGDIEQKEVEQYIENYIANIPSRKVNYLTANIGYKQEDQNFRLTNNPKHQSSVFMAYHNENQAMNYEDNVIGAITARIIKKRVYDIMRKEEGLTYGVSASYRAEPNGGVGPSLRFNFSVKPENEKRAIEIVKQAIAGLKTDPITKEEFEDKRDKELEDLERALSSNDKKTGLLAYHFSLGKTPEEIAQFEAVVKDIKFETLTTQMQKFVEDAYLFEAIFSDQ